MKIIIRKHVQSTTKYQRFASTGGWEFIDSVKDAQAFYDFISRIENQDFFEQESGQVTNCQGDEVFDPKYPTLFDFFDYTYHLVDASELSVDQISSVTKASPWNLADIVAESINMGAIEKNKWIAKFMEVDLIEGQIGDYHISWYWLMPVARKCWDCAIELDIDFASMIADHRFDYIAYGDLDEAHNAIYNFIAYTYHAELI